MGTALHLSGVVLPEGEHRDLWIVDGRVSTAPVPGAETIASGAYVVPGLVDAHCHVGIGLGARPADPDEAVDQARAERDAGVLLIRDCGVPIDTGHLRGREDLPRILRAGRHIGRPKRYLPGLGVDLDDPSLLPKAVAEQVEAGDGWVKLVGDWIDRSAGGAAADLAPLWPDDVLTEAIAVAHDAGARVTAHVFGEDALPGLLNAGIDCVEHGTGLTDDTIDLMARRGVALVPTLINIENFPSIADTAVRYPRYAAHMRDLHARVDATIGAAVEAGVPVYAGTDAGGGIVHGRIVDEIESLHRVGMSRERALSAACWRAREWLGHPNLEDGAPADLVVYRNDPRRDLTALRDPARIVLRGRVVR
ncbi:MULTISPECIES: amidohydrolase family protein [Actinoalloteichus]|uniref:amidohydrolase family protein n=1 Tax=Actinoalloteichus TaxID=65496 RepID=UPI00268118A5